jgi:drug/metabolite transporter (DMT)-like permease
MRTALIKLHIAIMLWGATGVLGKLIKVDALWVVIYRTGLTIIGLLIYHLFTNEIKPINLKQKKGNLLSGALLGLHWVFFFASIQYSNVAVALISLSCTSLFTSIIQSQVNKLPINGKEIILSCIAILSIALLFYSDFSLRKGVVFGLLSAMFVAAVPVLNKQQTVTQNATTISFWNMLGGFIVAILCIPILYSLVPQPNFVPSTLDFVWLLILSWVCTIVTYQLSLSALKKVNAFTQTLLLNLEPIYGIGLAAIFLNETNEYNIYFYIGIILLVLTILLQTFFIKKENAV